MRLTVWWFPQRHALRRAPVRRAGPLVVDDGRILGACTVGEDADRLGRGPGPGAEPGRSTSPAACWRPGSSTRTCTRSRAGSSGSRCDLSEARRPARTTSPRSRAYAAAHPDDDWILGGGWAMAGLPGRHADRRRPRPGGAGPAGLPAEPRPPRRLGQQPGARARRGRRRDTPDPPDGRIERDADGRPTGTLHEGAMALVGGLVPDLDRRGLPPRAARRAALPALARRHRRGRTRSSATTPAWRTRA